MTVMTLKKLKIYKSTVYFKALCYFNFNC